MPRSRWTVRSTAATSAVSCRSRPDDGSSARRIFGSAARARASSTRRQLPRPRALTDVSARRVMPTSSRVASTRSISSFVGLLMLRRSRQSRPSPRRARSATMQVVADRHVGEHLHPLIGAADAETGPLVGRQPGQSCIPSKTMSPDSGRSCPHTQLKSVVLPAPLGPTRPTLSPGATSNVMLCTAWIPPKDLHTPRRLRSGSAQPLALEVEMVGAARSGLRASASRAKNNRSKRMRRPCASGTRAPPRGAARTSAHRTRRARR